MQRSEANRWFILVLVCVAQFMVVLDATIVNVALPSIQRGLHFSASDLQWVVNAYTLVFGGFLLLGGRAADLLGRQRLFVAGVGLFSLASLVNGIATSSGMLIAGRGAQGLGAALVSPAALAIVTTTFAEGRERTKALGIWSAIAAGGGAVGLLLGGLITDTLSWRWVFFINLPIGIVASLLALRYIANATAEDRPETADVAGATTVTGGGIAQQGIRRLGVRPVTVTGMTIAALGLLLLSGIPTHGTYLANLLPGLALMSVGMGLTFVPVTLIATTGIEAGDAGLASGLFNTAQQVGGALGLAILSTIAASKTSGVLSGIAKPSHDQTVSALVDGYQVAFATSAGLILASVLIVLLLIRRRDVARINTEEPVTVPA
jgi:MFS family permease